MKTFKREDMDQSKQWKTEDIFKDKQEWQSGLKESESILTELEGTIETICSSAENLLSYIKLSDKLELISGKVYAYSFLKEDEDTADPQRQELGQMLTAFGLRYSEFDSKVKTEYMKMGKEKLQQFIKEEEKLKIYEKAFNNFFRFEPHILTDKEEMLMSQIGLLYNSSEIYSRLTNADMKFPEIKNENGEMVRLTKSNYSEFAESENREVRKEAATAYMDTFKKFQNTIASTLNSSLKEDYFYTKTKKYNSTLERSLFSDEVPTEVYHNLIKSVRANIEPMARYYDLKKKMLNLDELRGYDLRVSMVSNMDVKIPYEEAYQTMQEGLSVLGEDYITKLKEAYTGGWIDVYENEGKRSGAYSYGLEGVHPFVLLNHKDNMDSMFTLAHEMGHALHSYYSNKENDPSYRNYTIFVAEVASTVNEVLLMKHLLSKTTDKKMKMYLINQFLEQFRGTMYAQTMFAEFEHIIHQRVENNEPLTAEIFNQIYSGLTDHYDGGKITKGENAGIGWSTIPHFYNSFYVYKYATGFSAAISLAKQILEEGQPAVDRYLNFLKSGSTKAPIELLKDAGVDMSTSKPIEDAIQVFSELVTELENLI
jgi:oligoendopeptidase F